MRPGERGAALLIALGALALVGALAAAALSAATGPASRAAAAVEQARATRVAEAAVHRLAAAMARQELRDAARVDGLVVSTSFLDAKVDFAAQDVAGLINVNTAEPGVLRRLLQATGARDAARIADLWIAAREDQTGRGGFRDPEDALAALPEDLRPGAASALQHATVHGDRATVDPYRATAPALAAAANVTLAEAQGFVAARALAGRAAPLPIGADEAALAISDNAAARLTVRVETPRGGRAEVAATLRATRSPRAPIMVLSWR